MRPSFLARTTYYHWWASGLLASIVACCCVPKASAATKPARPNVIVFIADDLGWNDSGPYGNDAVRTPTLDRIAAEGMRFDRATLTCSSCSPSRCSILTGRYPHNTDAPELHLPLPADQVLVTTPLRKAGYWTAAVGKWHLGNAVTSQVDEVTPSPPERMNTAWIKSLRERPADKPFFLWAAHLDPHRPYLPDAVDPPHDPADVIVPPFFPDTPAVRRDLADYYDEVSRFDAHVGEVLAELESQGVADNTIVIVISDNGRPFPHCKTNVHVPGVRTPMLVRWPGVVSPGSVCKSVVSSIDLVPTILEAAGIDATDSHQGVSLMPLLHDPNKSVRRHAFAEHNWHDYRAFERSVHTEKFCYTRNWLPELPQTPPADAVTSPTFRAMQTMRDAGQLTAEQSICFNVPAATEMLFDVVADPYCVVNLAGLDEYAATVTEMRSALDQWQQETGDSFPGTESLTPDGFDRETGQKKVRGSRPDLATRNPPLESRSSPVAVGSSPARRYGNVCGSKKVCAAVARWSCHFRTLGIPPSFAKHADTCIRLPWYDECVRLRVARFLTRRFRFMESKVTPMKVLLASDGSEHAFAAAKFLSSLAGKEKFQVTIFSVSFNPGPSASRRDRTLVSRME